LKWSSTGVDCGFGLGVQTGSGGVGVGAADVVMVIWPGGVAKGSCVVRSAAMKNKLSGVGCQVRDVVALLAALTLRYWKLKRIPHPFSGVKSSEKHDIRRILAVGPVPFRMFAETFQFVAVSPAGSTNGVWNWIIFEL
jgi:hypothetical protein